MQTQVLMNRRINKEINEVLKNPIENIIMAKKTERQIHFCLHSLQHPYQKGFYHGVLELPENYPFSAPNFKFINNNGRFDAGKYVCTTFTTYHQESWSSSWTIRTILIAILSFFLSNQTGYGSLQQSKQKRAFLALKSLDQNFKNSQFRQLFKDQLQKMGIQHQQFKKTHKQIQYENVNQYEIKDQMQMNTTQIQSVMLPQTLNGIRRNQNNLILKILYGGLVCLIAVVIFLKI